MEHDHPSANEFLKRDIFNVNDYFQKNGVETWTLYNVFKFVTDDSNDTIENLMNIYRNQELPEQYVDDNVFQYTVIPRNLTDISSKVFEKQLDNIQKGIKGVTKVT